MTPKRSRAANDNLRGLIPYDEGEHADEPVERRLAPLRVGSQQHLGIGVGAETVPGRLKLVAQLEVVVDLAVVDDPVAAVGVGHRLLRRVGEVDDAEPTMAERNRAGNAVEDAPPRPVRPAMRDHVDMARVGREAQRKPDAAHL